METQLISGIIAGLLISAPLGPVGVLIIRKTINKGFKSGYLGGLGASLADTFFAIIAGFSVSIITNFLTTFQTPIRIGGAVILAVLGYKIFRTNIVKQLRQKAKKTTLWADFMHTYFLTLSNPLTIIAIGAVLATGTEAGVKLGQLEVSTFIFGVFFSTLLWWILLVTIINKYRKKISVKKLWYLNKIMGIIILVFAIAVFISSFI